MMHQLMTSHHDVTALKRKEIHCIKFGHGLLRLMNVPTSNCIDDIFPDVVGYFIIGEGEGVVDDIIFIEHGSKTLNAR